MSPLGDSDTEYHDEEDLDKLEIRVRINNDQNPQENLIDKSCNLYQRSAETNFYEKLIQNISK
jgi:hypothetical protein